MADILFRYLLMARERDRAWYRRPLLLDDPLTSAGVERLHETAAARVVVTAQFERVTREQRSLPASQSATIEFCDPGARRRPSPPHCETRVERLALQNTLAVYRCEGCDGRGLVECKTCEKRELYRCRICQGDGRDPHELLTACSACKGSGRVDCPSCQGLAWVVHEKCAGEGAIATWTEETYQYFVDEVARTVLPPGETPPELPGRVSTWLFGHLELVSSLNAESFAAQLGVANESVTAVAARAAHVEKELRETLVEAEAERLFTVTKVHLVPVSCCVLRSERRVVKYWLVGRGEQALEIEPPAEPEPLKMAGWSGLLATGATLALGAYLALPVEAGLVAAGLTATVGGLSSLVRPTRTVRTVVVLPSDGEPTAYLTCLAALGSYLGAFHLRDRTYAAQLQTLLGLRQPPRQSQTMTLALPDGTDLRLVEVVNAPRLAPALLQRMVRAVDGIIHLEPPGDAPVRMRELLAQAGGAVLAQARLVVTEDDDPSGLEGSGPVPLDLVRRAFIREVQAEVDWRAVFALLVAPVKEVVPIRLEARLRSSAQRK